jgi:prolipoprotein diacylglyceryltransferase
MVLVVRKRVLAFDGGMLWHAIFDLLASALAFQAMRLAHMRWMAGVELPAFRPAYGVALVVGAVVGAYGLGTANLRLSGVPEVGRSILGALCGAVVAIEVYKAVSGIKGSTGVIFVPAFCVAVMVGRIGCFLAGLPDQTYGTPSALPWAVDFGDGVLRHPVQLYESGAMAGFLLLAVWAVPRSPAFRAKALYLMTGFYAVERFGLEFLKPYAALVGPLNIFHLACLGLLAYSAVMIIRKTHV